MPIPSLMPPPSTLIGNREPSDAELAAFSPEMRARYLAQRKRKPAPGETATIPGTPLSAEDQ